MERHRDVVFLGPVGVGKTFLACALGDAACRAGQDVRFSCAPIISCRASTSVSSDRSIDQWIPLVDDPILAQGAIDRLAHDADQVVVERDGYRTRQRPRQHDSVPASPQAPPPLRAARLTPLTRLIP